MSLQGKEKSINTDFDIAIVGYGPIGATLANALGQLGYRVGVFEREQSVYHMPRASHLDAETLRVFQSLDLADHMVRYLIGAKGYDYVNEEGKVLLKFAKPEGKSSVHGWNHHYRFYQPTLEKILREGVERFPNVEVFLNSNVTELKQEDQYVTIAVQSTEASNESVSQYTASFVVGCDGGRSTVRQHMGIEMYDIGLRQKWLVVDVKLNEGTKRPDTMPEVGIQYCEPSRPITYVPEIGDHDRFRWEMMLMPGETKEEMEKPEKVWSLLSRWLKPEQAVLERAAVYVFHSVIAQEWRVGRMLLAGDAAHQTPPFLGQGMCAGIRDVSNLVWKLDLVLKGRSNIRLLDSYQSERTYHVRKFINMATDLGKVITVTDRGKAAERDLHFLSDEPKTWYQPDPSLGWGVFLTSHPMAGFVFPQPRLKDGRRLDEVVGLGFAVIGTPEVFAGFSDETRATWHELGVVVINDDGEEVRKICEEHGAQAFIIRPDRYVYGAVKSAADMDAMTKQLKQDIVSAFVY
ncbi:UNVERIFIED_CONTAM: 3-(3-hydroxy-phenyl)propionate hydroxylase [Brevibacillus sp. OAP136]